MTERLKRFLFSLAGAGTAAALILSCGKASEKDYVDFLYSSMPLPDSLVYPRSYWEENVSKTLEVRDKMGWNIPEREFRHFVLPLRVNNEDLDNFRTLYADTLCRRVQGMSLEEAAIEINHWCHEQATYKPSDGRTLSPTATMRSGLGRCGEESVLAVAALRAAGIPARQVYTPRWAHTDDNHAWVEVWVDGKWYFMGACEPEPVLNLAWFNAPVSRAMLLHTKVYGGSYNGPEDVISRTHAYTEINVIKSYIHSIRRTVTVRDSLGKAVEGANVEFKIYNYAEFYPVARYLTDGKGQASLDTGKGDIVVWASKDNCFGLAVVSGEDGEVVLNHRFGKDYGFDLDIVPPKENPLPDNSTEEQRKENTLRLAEEDAVRDSHPHPKTPDKGLYLSDKDAVDVPEEVIEDALKWTAEENKNDRYIVSPRIERERLLPFKGEILSSGIAQRLHTPEEVVSWVRDSITIDTLRNPQMLRIPPVAVWRSRLSDGKSRDIFFVALCRTLGFPARIDPVTSVPQYRTPGDQWKWADVKFDSSTPVEERSVEEGHLVLEYGAEGSPKTIKTPRYYTHFTLSRVEDGTCHLCEYDEGAELKAGGYSLKPGYYLLTSGTRRADGSVLSHVEMFQIKEGSLLREPLILRESTDAPSVIGNMDAEQLFLPEGADKETSILSVTGRGYFLVCVMGERDEPSIHAKGQLEALSGELNAWGRKVLVLGGARPQGLDNAVFGSDPESKVSLMLRRGVQDEGRRLPQIALCDSFGRIVYYSQGYNTSLSSDLSKILFQLE